MSWATLETLILFNAREAFKNSKLRKKDLREWSSGEIEPQDGEVTIHLPDPGVYVTILAEHDKRQKAPKKSKK